MSFIDYSALLAPLTNQLSTLNNSLATTNSAVTNLSNTNLIITDPGNVTLQQSNQSFMVVINKTVNEATTITLPPNPFQGQVVLIKDQKGNANLYNITINSADGSFIDGAANFVMTGIKDSMSLLYLGSQWCLSRAYKNPVTFSTVAYTGSYTDLTNKPTIPDTSNLVTNASLASTLGSYPTSLSLSTQLANYVSSTSLTTSLASYETITAHNASLVNYPKVYNSSGLIASPKVWIGSATTASNGTYSCNYSSAGFTSTPSVNVIAISGGTQATSYNAIMSSASTTVVSGTVYAPTASVLGILPTTAVAAGITVQVQAIGV